MLRLVDGALEGAITAERRSSLHASKSSASFHGHFGGFAMRKHSGIFSPNHLRYWIAYFHGRIWRRLRYGAMGVHLLLDRLGSHDSPHCLHYPSVHNPPGSSQLSRTAYRRFGSGFFRAKLCNARISTRIASSRYRSFIPLPPNCHFQGAPATSLAACHGRCWIGYLRSTHHRANARRRADRLARLAFRVRHAGCCKLRYDRSGFHSRTQPYRQRKERS